jgi:hypothetical protein
MRPRRGYVAANVEPPLQIAVQQVRLGLVDPIISCSSASLFRRLTNVAHSITIRPLGLAAGQQFLHYHPILSVPSWILAPALLLPHPPGALQLLPLPDERAWRSLSKKQESFSTVRIYKGCKSRY